MHKHAILCLLSLALLSCSKENKVTYSNDLSNPEVVLDNYIKALVNGDTKQIFYYITGNYNEFDKRMGRLGILLAQSMKEKADKRFKELYKWQILGSENLEGNTIVSVKISVPNGGKIADKILDLMGEHYDENGKVTYTKGLTQKEAQEVVRRDASIPTITKVFSAVMEKNEYGWVYSGSPDNKLDISDFIQ